MENRKIRYQFDRLPMVLFIACLAIIVVAGQINPEYDPGKEDMKLFKITKPLVLTCTAANPADTEKIYWTKEVISKDASGKTIAESKKVKDVNELKGRFELKPKEGRFTIEKTIFEDAGNYSCHLDGVSKNFNVYANIIVKIPENSYAEEEKSVEINCIVKGTDPEISWYYRSENSLKNESELLIESDRVQFHPHENINGARLVIKPASLADRGYYKCVGNNVAMNEDAESEGFTRVKGKLAALWPFLGICAEVFVLCAIILIYEKRRNKTDLDESDTDQSPDQLK